MGTRGIEGKSAIITGAASGLGKAMAFAFAKEGAKVTIADVQTDALYGVAAEIEANQGEVLALAIDVSKADQLDELASRAAEQFGAVGILVNNAGVSAPGSGSLANVADLDPEAWHRLMAVNLTAVFLLTKAVLPGMLAGKNGRVINISSAAGKIGLAQNSAYSASKHAVIGFTRSLALEVAAEGITANSICPGWAWTGIVKEGMERRARQSNLTADEWRKKIEEGLPSRRMIEADEVADLAVFLASYAARGINGQSLSIDGGQVMH